MNIIEYLQGLMAQVPDLLQPIIVAVAGAIPFVEGELSSVLGVWAGINPLVAAIAAILGNFAAVIVIVMFGTKIRAAILNRRANRTEMVAAGTGTIDSGSADAPVTDGAGAAAGATAGTGAKLDSKGAQRFKRFLVRFGVPGASILGPLAIPTHFTSAILVSMGVAKQWILLWQGVAIVLWTSLTTLIATGVLNLIMP